MCRLHFFGFVISIALFQTDVDDFKGNVLLPNKKINNLYNQKLALDEQSTFQQNQLNKIRASILLYLYDMFYNII